MSLTPVCNTSVISNLPKITHVQSLGSGTLLMASPDDSGPAHVLSKQIPRKRPGSGDDNPSTAATRAARNRAPRACVSCRDRKVRCDVVSGGVPCTNCRLDDVDCVLKASNRGKHNSARHPARSRLPSSAVTAPGASSPVDTIHVHTRAASDESAPASGPATVVRSGPGQPRERRAHGEEEATCDHDEAEHNGQGDRQGAEQTRTIQDAQFQPNTTVHEAHREQQPQPRPTRGAVMPSTPSAQPANPPTSDDLVALAFQGKIDASITVESCRV